MMRTVTLVIAFIPSVLLPSAAHADKETGTTTNAYFVKASEALEAKDSAPVPTVSNPSISASIPAKQDVSTSEPLTWVPETVCDPKQGGGCVTAQHCSDNSIAKLWLFLDKQGNPLGSDSQCPGDEPPTGGTPEPTVTPARVREAFERVPLPESDIIIQPEGGETLVNHPTFYRTNATDFDETVTFFGGRITVVLHITPTTFHWNHGDGTTATTTDPGSPYTPSMGLDYDHLVFHHYAKATKKVPVSVDTTWTATWTLNGRNMGTVPGTVTKTGTPQTLDIYEARPVLVS